MDGKDKRSKEEVTASNLNINTLNNYCRKKFPVITHFLFPRVPLMLSLGHYFPT